MCNPHFLQIPGSCWSGVHNNEPCISINRKVGWQKEAGVRFALRYSILQSFDKLIRST